MVKRPFETLPVVMHELDPGGASYAGQFGFIPFRDDFDHKTRDPAAIEPDAREHYARSFAAPGVARAGFDYYRALQ